MSVVMNVYRLALAFSFPIFFEQRPQAMGLGWTLGTAAIVSLVATIHIDARAGLEVQDLRGVVFMQEIVSFEEIGVSGYRISF